ncbi:bifunctional adenosylcobinamide kinase/adenosylcobinamide-phosphate guanylyltransferase [Anaerostipes sp.]|uniref:bifunctional adenosylcobinamide kinase/adenosylcobinamide-phosphate guanylyltransferase n=1 Tax=Anaerostipes sp. TaxID=1872530 RepID=UPI0025C4E868|nr:bifunctional adenosylcobinamide kinase/adenosylcobinamide-phosphate guanylyltransferase [Anaerostipes sp.]MBS7007389.1 bifunctional adenosylcobinamide kinase/adenosylcobinamide-phosphate guanylyltransferase [Anaerostipes sp.]
MILIIGGAFQGKKRYAEEILGILPEQMADGAVCGEGEIDTCRCMFHFQDWVRRRMPETEDWEREAERIVQANPDVVLIADELGCGIVPADAADRKFREMEGRLLTCLAKESREVHRVVCGIGTVIKG